MNKNDKKVKKNIYLIGAVCLIIIVTILLVIIFNKNNNENINNLKVNFENDNTIMISNRLPMTDIAGKQLTGEGTSDDIQGFVEFSIESVDDKKQDYVIYLNDKKVNAAIDSKHVRLYLTDFDDNAYDGFDSNIIPCYEDFKVSKNSPSDKILFNGTLNGKEKKNFRLRVWVSDTYTLRDSEETLSFDVKVKSK